MNILHIVRTLEPGGLERVVRDLARGLHTRGHRLFLACLYEPGSWYSPEEWDGLWTGSGRSRLLALNRLSRFAREHGIEVVHSHNPEPHRAATGLAFRTGLPLIHTKHGRNYPNQWRRVWLNRWLNRAARSVVAVSENAARVARDIERVPQQKLRLVRNGVDTARYVPADRDRSSAARQRLGLDADAFVVGSVGRLAPEKHCDLLIRAFARLAQMRSGWNPTLQTENDMPILGDGGTTSRLRLAATPKHAVSSGCHASRSAHQLSHRQEPDACLLLVGAGPEEARLKNLANELGVNNRIVFAGNQEDLRPYYAAMDVFALSSLTEGMSLTLLEAGASGLACVATDVGGNAEIVEQERTGLIVPSDDESGLTAALDRLCRDETLRARFGAAARRRIAEHFSLEAMVNAYESLYIEIT